MALIRHKGRRVKGRAPSRLPSGHSPARSIGDALDRATAEDSASPLAAPHSPDPAAVPEDGYPWGAIPPAESCDPADRDAMIDRIVRRRLAEPSILDAGPVELTVAPVIGDSVVVPEPQPGFTREDALAFAALLIEVGHLPPAGAILSVGAAPQAPPDLSGSLTFGSPGWDRVIKAARIRNGELENLHTLCNQAMGRVVAGLATAAWNVRDAISEAWREVCIGLGRPDQVLPGWRRIRDEAEAAAQRRKPSFTPAAAAPPTRPQPVLRDDLPTGRAA